jgi:hypothetical protein
MKTREILYLCIASAGGCREVTISGKTYDLPNMKPYYRFTGNLYNRYPVLKEFQPLPRNHYMRFLLTPEEASWYFMYEGKPFNFYPIWIRVCRIRSNSFEVTPSFKLGIEDAFNISRKVSSGRQLAF